MQQKLVFNKSQLKCLLIRLQKVPFSFDRFDAITQIKNGSTYAFVGDMFWRINSQGVDPGFPKATKDIWVGFEGSVDAALSFGDTVDIFQVKHLHDQ